MKIESHLEEIASDDQVAGEMRPHGVIPYLVGEEWVPAGYEMGEYQRLHPGFRCQATDLLGGRVIGDASAQPGGQGAS